VSDYLAIYERNADGWWAYVPDLPGCVATGVDRDEAERNVRDAIVAHVDLLRSTGRPVPTSRAAV